MKNMDKIYNIIRMIMEILNKRQHDILSLAAEEGYVSVEN